MPIDFGKLGGNSADTVLHPRDIFNVLPAKAPRYEHRWDVQTEVWNQWFDRRTVRDLTIKMNTGTGKTAVGLLILKSCLNEGVRPAVYIAPNPQMALPRVARLGSE